MKYKKKTKIPKKLTEEEIQIIRRVNEHHIAEILTTFNLYKKGYFACEADPIIEAELMIKDGIIMQKDIEKNEKIIDDLANSKIHPTILIDNEYMKLHPPTL